MEEHATPSDGITSYPAETSDAAATSVQRHRSAQWIEGAGTMMPHATGLEFPERATDELKVLRYGLTLALMALISVLSLTPNSTSPEHSGFEWFVHFTPTLTQKILHVCVYACLTVSLAWSLMPVASSRARLLLSPVIAVGFGATMEWLQIYVPGRFGSLTDVLFNGFGALVGVAVSQVWKRQRRP